MHVRGAASALLLFGVVACAQTVQNSAAQNTASPSTAEMTSHDAPATFTTKVNLVMVPVVVRDGKGKAIGTLQKEDFQLFDKGKPQVISKFSVEKAGEGVIPAEVATDEAAIDKPDKSTAPAAPIAQRFVVYLFDDVHTSTADLMQARTPADPPLT